MTLTDYASFSAFFCENRAEGLTSNEALHEAFKEVFDKFISENVGYDFIDSERSAISIVMYFRAAKYLFTIQELALAGSLEEARTLLRSVVEATIWGYLLHKDDDTFRLWEEPIQLKVDNTDSAGNVTVGQKKRSRFKIDRAMKAVRHLRNGDEIYSWLAEERDHLSTAAHENLFEIVVRVNLEEGNTTFNPGKHGTSPEISRLLTLNLDLIERVAFLASMVRDEHAGKKQS